MYVISWIVFMGTRMFGDFWVGMWVRDKLSLSKDTYSLVFLLVNVFLLCLVIWMSFIHSVGTANAAKRLTTKLTAGVLRNKLEFFESTPIGVILNRFTNDSDLVDTNLSSFLTQFHFNILMVVTSFVLMMIAIPYMIIVVI